MGTKSHFSATDRTLASVLSVLTGRVRSRKRLSGTLLMLTGLWNSASCAASCASERPVQRPVQRPVAAVDSVVARSERPVQRPVQRPVHRSILCSVLCSVRCSILCIGTSCAASCAFCELVSSRSCVRLGSYLHAWTLLDILGLLLCS